MLSTAAEFRNHLPSVGTGPLARSRGAKLRYVLLLLLAIPTLAQDQPKDQQPPSKDQPQVRVNYLNVCNPSAADQQEIRTALARVPPTKFTSDFEITRGKTTIPDAPIATYVRIRHEFPAAVPFIAAQYSLSVDEKSIIEDLVFRSRDPKDIIQVQLEDTVTGAPDPKAVLATDTPINHIKLERFGKPSVALARCQGVDQSPYEPLFTEASQLMNRYRTALGTKRLVPRELAMLGALPAETKPPSPKPSHATAKK